MGPSVAAVDRAAHGFSPDALAAALRRAGIADVDASVRRRAEYSSDASLYRVVPAAVAYPRAPDEIEAARDVCARLGVPIVARGAGTSIAGNAIGTGLVLDTSRHLRRIVAVDPDARTAVVEPGVVLDDLQRAARPFGLRFGPDPSTHDRCTIGGMIGNNACGAMALGYGRTSDNVVGLEVLAGAGWTATLGEGLPAPSTLDPLRDVVTSALGVIRTELGTFPRQISGYALHHLLPENGFDVARALVGTEGSCALTLRATLRLAAVPDHSALFVVGFPDMIAAADAVPAVLGTRPVAVEGLDARVVDVVRRTRGAAAVPPLSAAGFWLLVALAGPDPGDIASRATALDAIATDVRRVDDPVHRAALWRIREDGAGLVARPTAATRRHAGWEDAAVPPQRLGGYLRDFRDLLARHRLTGVPYGHFGDGCVHIRLDFALGSPAGVPGFREFLEDAARLVAAHGGSMSGEHGDGRARSELLAVQYTPAALAAFAAVKGVFDPANLLNPGVGVDPRPLDADLRLPAAGPLRVRLGLHYPDDAGDLTRAVHRCTGVGRCRSETPAAGAVMCPSFRATRDEKDSTRGRARVLQELANSTLIDGWRAPEIAESLDLCLACKGCAADCPTGVDMATYKAEALHQRYRHRPRPPAHYALGWLPAWSRAAARAPRLANALLGSPLAGPGRALAGIDRRRALPRFATERFGPWFEARPVEREPREIGPPVLLWVDTFTDRFAPDVARAAVRVLEHAGYAVRLPDKPVCCALPWITTGQLGTARRVLRRGTERLRRAGADGTPIVGLEPSCVATLRDDAARLLGPDAPGTRAGAAVRTLAELLTATPGWAPPDLTGRQVLAQPHCHHHAVLGWSPDAALLAATGAAVSAVGGCCGLAGSFGAERGHHEISVAVAELDLLPAVRAAPDTAILAADGFSCRTQLDQLAGRRALHLAEILDPAPPGSPAG